MALLLGEPDDKSRQHNLGRHAGQQCSLIGPADPLYIGLLICHTRARMLAFYLRPCF